MNHKLKMKRIYLSPPHMSSHEMPYVQDSFKSNYIAPLGPQLDAFEKEFSEYTGIKHCVAVSSGTAALHLALRSIGIISGDEVVASTLTFIGSITPILFQDASPVFIDADLKSWNMDPILLEEELESCDKKGILPKAVIPTDLYGQCADYERIFEICERFGIPVVVDAAEAMGATYCEQHAGVGARAAVFSFNGNKIITTSGGGMLASDDKKLIDYARKLSQQARESVLHYEHEELGYNYRMSNILAAIGRGQLMILDERVDRKREIFHYYKKKLGNITGVEFMPEASYGKSNRWLTVVLISSEEFGVDRNAVCMALEAENIEARPVWKPMHLQPLFQVASRNNMFNLKSSSKRSYRARVIGGQVAESLFNRGLCLPSGTAMTDKDLNRVIEVVMQCRI